MKIGVFGDSFAVMKYNTTPSWVDILAGKYNVTNHSIIGSNLYYSVEEIKKHHLNYDKIIFVVTEPGRMKVADWIPLDSNRQFVTGKLDKQYIHREELNQYEELVYEAASQYVTCFHDDVYEKYIHNLMLDDIKKVRADMILIPAFMNSWYNINYSPMIHIYAKENTAWNLAGKTVIEEYNDIRNCHMIAENNVIFAEKAEHWLNGNHVNINLNDFVTTTDKDFYLKKL
jgi:hypothetical protein